MQRTYRFVVVGTDALGHTWKTESVFLCEFNEVFDLGMTDSFHQLTEGRAIYGQPGTTCKGPYDIEKILVTKRKES